MFDGGVGALLGSAEADGDVSLTVLVERLADAAPSPTVIGMLAGLPLEALEDRERVLVLKAWERQAGWMAAAQQQALVAVAGLVERDADDNSDYLAEIEIGAALRLSPAAAQQRLAVARTLEGRLPATAAALAAGQINYMQARVIAEETDGPVGFPGPRLSAAQLASIEASVLRRAEHLTVGQTRNAARRAVLAARPREADDEHAEAAQRRRVEKFDEPNAMASLHAFGPAPDVQLIWNALDARAARLGPDDDRDIGARRFDALVDISRASLADPDAPRAQGRPYDVGVVIDLDTLLGLRDNPAELRGHGPIPPALARALAADGRWRRWVVDPGTRHLIDLGAERYEPGQVLRDLLLARSPVCEAPACAMPSHRCDLDHTIDFPTGKTLPENMGPGCRRHHNGKTHGGVEVERHWDGSLTWTSPAGVGYHVPPPEILPGLQLPPPETELPQSPEPEPEPVAGLERGFEPDPPPEEEFP